MTGWREEVLSDSVRLIQGDCREILPTLPKPHAVISDPPYGIAHVKGSGGKGNHNRRNIAPIVGDASPFDPAPLLAFENVLIWGAEHYAARLPADTGRWLAWNKLDDMASYDSFSDVEFAWHSKRGAARIFNYKWKGIASVKAGEDVTRQHPTQKPIGLMCWCIEQAATPPLRLSSRSLHGFRYDRRRGSSPRPKIHRHRNRSGTLRHRVSAHLKGGESKPTPTDRASRSTQAGSA